MRRARGAEQRVEAAREQLAAQIRLPLNSAPDGHALIEALALPEKPTGVTQVLLTLEPAGGSPLPTTAPFVGGTLVRS